MCPQLVHKEVKRLSRLLVVRTKLTRTAEIHISLEYLIIDALTDAGIYNRPPPSSATS